MTNDELRRNVEYVITAAFILFAIAMVIYLVTQYERQRPDRKFNLEAKR